MNFTLLNVRNDFSMADANKLFSKEQISIEKAMGLGILWLLFIEVMLEWG